MNLPDQGRLFMGLLGYAVGLVLLVRTLPGWEEIAAAAVGSVLLFLGVVLIVAAFADPEWEGRRAAQA